MSLHTFSNSFDGVLQSLASLTVVANDAALMEELGILQQTAHDLLTGTETSLALIEQFTAAQHAEPPAPEPAKAPTTDAADDKITHDIFIEDTQEVPRKRAMLAASALTIMEIPINPFAAALTHRCGKELLKQVELVAEHLRAIANPPEKVALTTVRSRMFTSLLKVGAATHGMFSGSQPIALDFSLLSNPAVGSVISELQLESALPQVLGLLPTVMATYQKAPEAGLADAVARVLGSKAGEQIITMLTTRLTAHFDLKASEMERKILPHLAEALVCEARCLQQSCNTAVAFNTVRAYADSFRSGKNFANLREYAQSICGDAASSLVGMLAGLVKDNFGVDIEESLASMAGPLMGMGAGLEDALELLDDMPTDGLFDEVTEAGAEKTTPDDEEQTTGEQKTQTE